MNFSARLPHGPFTLSSSAFTGHDTHSLVKRMLEMNNNVHTVGVLLITFHMSPVISMIIP